MRNQHAIALFLDHETRVGVRAARGSLLGTVPPIASEGNPKNARRIARAPPLRTRFAEWTAHKRLNLDARTADFNDPRPETVEFAMEIPKASSADMIVHLQRIGVASRSRAPTDRAASRCWRPR